LKILIIELFKVRSRISLLPPSGHLHFLFTAFVREFMTMKFKYSSALITTLIVSITAALPAWAETATLRGPTTSRINVRESPSTDSRVRHYGLGGDRVTILNETNAPDGYRWYFVEFPQSGARGWIRGDLLSVNAGSPERVSFAPGTAAATVGGNIRGSQSRSYLVNARAGQTMTTSTIGTSSFLQVLVFAPNGRNLYTGSRNWSGVLPQSGDYRVQVRIVPEEQQSGATAEYSLTIGVR
jgi:hypothetical protein